MSRLRVSKAQATDGTIVSKVTASTSLLTFAQLPQWYEGNEYILTAYRPVAHTATVCFKSLTYLHNESVNIFTHLVPGILACGLAVYVYQNFFGRYPHATIGDRAVFVLQLCTAVVCFGVSAAYHSFMNHSAHISALWLRLDYVGIITLILGEFISGIYVSFYCEPFLQKLYWSMIGSLGILAAYIVLNPKYQSLEYRSLRLFTFIATGLSAFFPVIHSIVLLPTEDLFQKSGLHYYFLEGVLILLGAAAYGFKYPECVMPGKFDIWGASHQIFHVLIVLATVVHTKGIWSAFEYNYARAKCDRLT